VREATPFHQNAPAGGQNACSSGNGCYFWANRTKVEFQAVFLTKATNPIKFNAKGVYCMGNCAATTCFSGQRTRQKGATRRWIAPELAAEFQNENLSPS